MPIEMRISPINLAAVSGILIRFDEISFEEGTSPPPILTKEIFALVLTNKINPIRKNTQPTRVDSVTFIINHLITHNTAI